MHMGEKRANEWGRGFDRERATLLGTCGKRAGGESAPEEEVTKNLASPNLSPGGRQTSNGGRVVSFTGGDDGRWTKGHSAEALLWRFYSRSYNRQQKARLLSHGFS